MENYEGKSWFINLQEYDKLYLIEHRDPSHMIVYLKRGLNFNDSLRKGYIDAMREEEELVKNTLTAKDNLKSNVLDLKSNVLL